MTSERRLNIPHYIQGVPVTGYCTKCGLTFRTDLDLMAKPEEAMRIMYEQFYRHFCHEHAPQSQAA